MKIPVSKRVRLSYKEKLKLVLYVESNPDKKLADYHRIAQDLYSTDSCPSLKIIAEIIKKKDFIKKNGKRTTE